MHYWLMKSEPNTFSFADLKRLKISPWDGVRNFQARNFMKQQKIGDKVLFYHSSADPSGVVGLAKVVREAYPDFTQFDPKSQYFDARATLEKPYWYMVDVAYVKELKHFVSLEEIKKNKLLKNMILVQRSRLSVQPVTEKEWEIILAMGS